MKFLLVLGFCTLLANTNAFKCYQCEYYEKNQITQGGCDAEPVPAEFLVDCNQTGYKGDDWQCVKKTGKIIDEDDEEYKYVSRFCSAGQIFDNACKESDALDSSHGEIVEKGQLCYCSSEQCNGSAQIQFGTLIAIVSSIAFALRYYN